MDVERYWESFGRMVDAALTTEPDGRSQLARIFARHNIALVDCSSEPVPLVATDALGSRELYGVRAFFLVPTGDERIHAGDAGGPHSRACGITRHDHGPDCHPNCPTCGGKRDNPTDAARAYHHEDPDQLGFNQHDPWRNPQ